MCTWAYSILYFLHQTLGDWQHTWEERHAQQIWLKVGQFWANIKLNMTKIILFADLFSSANSTKCQNCMLWNSNTLCLMSHHMLMVSSPDILSAQMDTWYHAWSTRTIYTNITENNTWYFHLGDVNVEQREKSGMSFSRKRRSILLVCTTYNVYNAHIEYVHITFLVNNQEGKEEHSPSLMVILS